MKLYEIILRKLGWWKDPPPEVQETKVYNPLNAKVGSSVVIDTLDYRGRNLFVKEVREVAVGGDKFTDYVLVSKDTKGDLTARLRLVPGADAVLLTLLEQMGYSEDFHNIVKDESGKFNVEEDGRTDEYWRVADVKIPHTAVVTTMQDDDGNGRVDANEVKTENVEFWDYSRLTQIEGVQKEEFVFVEMNGENGWFQIWRGVQINPDSVRVY